MKPKLEPGQNKLEDVACIQLGPIGERSSIDCESQTWLIGWLPCVSVHKIGLIHKIIRKIGLSPRKTTTDSCERNFYVRLCTPLQLIFSTSCSGEPTVSNWAHSIMIDKKCTGCSEKEGREALWLPSSERIHSEEKLSRQTDNKAAFLLFMCRQPSDKDRYQKTMRQSRLI